MTSSPMVEPEEGMEFESQEAAYSFYKEYAKGAGFGTAKLSSRRSRASKEFIDAKFSCIRYGNKQQSDDALNPRPSPKIGCKASLHVKRRQADSLWYVYRFVKHHNHDLLPDQAHFFRSHNARKRKSSSSSSASKLFSAYQNVGTYVRSLHDKGRSLSLEAGDAQWLLHRLAAMKEDNPNFFFALDLNEDHRLRNVFWVDPKAMEDYSKFRDVVSFDTAYFSGDYRIPLVLFVGVNQHARPALLGCALVADETAHSLGWVMRTWLLAMEERPPGVILSDQSEAIKAAVAGALPGTRHCFSLWHLMERIPRQLEFLGTWHDSFVGKLNKCIHKPWSEEEFERRWWKLVERFNLGQVEWVQALYEDRARWAPVFMRGVSLAGMSTASRAESCSSLFDKYVQRETSLREFMERYRGILEDAYEDEAKAKFDAWHETPELKSPSPFEKQMCAVYTQQVFKKFQAEVLGAAACHLKKEEGIAYSVKDFEHDQSYRVEWEESRAEIRCACGSFELRGFLCRHAMLVLQMCGVFCIPAKYVLHRWTNSAASPHLVSTEHRTRRYNDLCRRAIILGEEGSLSEQSYNAALSAIKEALKQSRTQCPTLDAELPPNTA